MKKLNEKIQSLTEGTKYDIPLIGSRGKLYRVTDKAIQLNCVNNGMIWIPKSQIVHIQTQEFREVLIKIHLKTNQ